jgi:4-alpha-glucanotransferase
VTVASSVSDLELLAGLYGVQTSYQDAQGRRQTASPDSLLAVLQALNAPLDGPDDIGEALRARREDLEEQLAEPVVVAWDGRAPELELRPRAASGPLGLHLDLEDGSRRAWTLDLATLPAGPAGVRRLTLPERLPLGYHHLRVEAGGRAADTLVIAAPSRAYEGPGSDTDNAAADPNRLWGVFLPLYALRTKRGWGAGDLTDLEALATWTAGLGGGVVATLPLLAAFLDEPLEPSPYSPASRQFWNELYLDPRELPELADTAGAQRLIAAKEFSREAAALAAAPQVDYARLMFLKRRVLEEMAHRFFGRESERRDRFERYVESKPELATWAAFRAVMDRRGEAWTSWPERLRDGSLAKADFDEEDRRYHLWVQWAMDEQMRSLAAAARRRGPGLYLDLPLGVHGASYDVWREQDLFVQAVSAGAPPDTFFTKGQDWGFPPLSPERLRDQGYRHLIACLRHHLEHAGLLRIDHVMQLHRLFWIPRGGSAADGVYVRYPADELYAILALESHRHKAVIVGENLGTVPPEVGEAMDRHGVLGMYVLQYELQPGNEGDLRPPPADSVASLNTHDMPTFAAFWQGKDVDDLRDLGLFDARQAQEEKERREQLRAGMAGLLKKRPKSQEGAPDPADAETYNAVLRDRLEWLAASPARLVLVNLEDLWGETAPQNTPGTHLERANWRRKARLTLEEIEGRKDIAETLRRIDELRRGKS